MAVPPRLPNLAPEDMKWVRWATQELTGIRTHQATLSSNVTAATQQASTAHTAVTTVVEKTAAQEAVNPSMPVGPPQVPSAPTLSTDHATVTIKWDGLVHGNNAGGTQLGSLMEPAVGFNHVSAERGTSATGPWTPVGGAIRKVGSLVDTDVTVNTTYWYHLITSDNTGAMSAASDATPVLVKGVDLGSLDQDVKQALQDAQDAAQAGIDAAAAGAAAAQAAHDAANSAAGQAATALQAANDANTKAQNALDAAEGATGTSSVYIGTSQPSDTTGQLLWIDITNGANTPKRYVSGTWTVLTDKAAVDAAAAAVAAQTAAQQAQTTANTAVTNAQTAQGTANTALTAANGKNKVYYQGTQPGTTGNTVGDTWFDTANGNRISRWDGSTWALQQLGSAAIGTGAIGSTQLATSINNSITNAQTKTTTFYQNTAPSTTGRVTGDTWFDTGNGYKIYVWNGAWTASALGGAAIAAGAVDTTQLSSTVNTSITNAATAAGTAQTTATNAQTTANGKNMSFYSTSAPSNTTNPGTRQGDIWFVQDASGNVTGHYVWSGSAWIAQVLTNSVLASLDAGKINTGTLAAARIAAGTITGTMIAGTTITASNIASGTITANEIAGNTITAAKIAAGTITSASGVIGALDAGAITTGTLAAARIGANSIAASQLIAGTINAASVAIADGAITNAKIADLAVSTAKIADLAVNNAKINDLNGNKITAATIVAGKLATDSVTTNNIVAGSIDTNRLAAGAITADKISLGSSSSASPIDRVPQSLDNGTFWSRALATNSTFTGVSQGAANAATSNGTYGSGITVNNGGYVFLTQQVPVPPSRKLVVSGTSDDGQGNLIVRAFTSATAYVDTGLGVVPSGVGYTFADNALSYYVYATSANGKGYQRYISAHVFEVIGGNSGNGQAAQLSPSGLQLFDANGQLAVDLTTNAQQYLSIVDNTQAEPQTVAVVDQYGNAAFTEVSSDNGFDVQGMMLTDTNDQFSLFNATPNGSTWTPNTPMLDRLSRGCIYDVTWSSLNDYTIPAANNSLRIAQDSFILEDGRQYAINVHNGALQTDSTVDGDFTNATTKNLGGNLYFEMQLSLTPIANVTTGVNILRSIVWNGTRGTFTTQIPVFSASVNQATIDNEGRRLPAGVPIYWQIDVSAGQTLARPWKLNEFGYARGVSVIDLGASSNIRPNNGADALANVGNFVKTTNTTTGTAGSGSAGSTATSKTVTFTAKSSRTFKDSGATIVTGSGQYTNGSSMYVGTGTTPMGSWFGNFQTSGGTSMASVLSGKTITAASLTLKNNYTYSSSGSTNQFGTGSSATAPTSIGAPSSNVFSASFAKGQTKSINLSSAIRSGLAAGTVQAFVIGVQSGYGGIYGYYAGASQSGAPKLTVTYH